MTHPIVVGYDGSPASDLALDWAAQAALDRHLPLRILVAWTMPPVNRADSGSPTKAA